MNTLQHWQIILKNQNYKAFEYIYDANKYKNTDYKGSAINIRYFLENIVKDIMRLENIDEYKLNTLSDKIQVLKNEEIINQGIYKSLHTARRTGNKGAHEDAIIDKEELDTALEISKKIGKYYVIKYLLKRYNDAEQAPVDEGIELPEIQEHEAYVFECTKPECKILIKNRTTLKVCKKCGGPVIYKDIETSYIPQDSYYEDDYLPEDDKPIFIQTQPGFTTRALNDGTEVLKKTRHKFEIYNIKEELVREINLIKDEIIIGRTSSTFKNVDVDLKDLSYDDEGNCLVSKYQAYLIKENGSYFIQNKSEKSTLRINKEYIEYNANLVRLEHEDLIIINEFIALMYIVY